MLRPPPCEHTKSADCTCRIWWEAAYWIASSIASKIETIAKTTSTCLSSPGTCQGQKSTTMQDKESCTVGLHAAGISPQQSVTRQTRVRLDHQYS